MIIKASVQFTISKIIDITACHRYYKLQSSTLAKPDKPVTNPPDSWSDTEPAYVSGSTNTLYFVDCNVYSDNTFTFSEVSKSSSYEAAKDAWNKANNAQDSIDNLEIGGRNLAIYSGDLTKWVRESDVTVTKEGDWFKVLDSAHTNARYGIYLDVAIEPNTTYTFSVYGKRGNVKAYAGGGPIETNTFGKNYEIIDDEKLIVTLTSGSSEKTWRVYLCVMPSTAGAYAYFKLPKLERGNKATDWTPAPEDIDTRVTKAETAIDNTQDLISLKATTEEVTERANRADELDNALQEAQTLIEQNRTAIGELSMSSSDFVVKFEKITKQITNLNGDLSSYKEEIGNWMRFDSDGNLVLGATRVAGQDAYELKLTKNRISFMLNDIEVAYISSNQLYITNSTVVQNLKIGGFTWEVRANGNLGLIYR